MAGVINPPADSSKNLTAYIDAAKGAAGVAPASVQGGVIGAAKAASPSGTSSASTSKSATGSAATTSATPGAGVESRGTVNWVAIVITGVAAWGVGSLIL